MLNRFDESELLALIEGTLEVAEAEDLWRRLDADPKARGLMEAMIEDRSLLRSAQMPPLARDFLADLEPRLSRPMLVGTPPGQFRRQHRREQRRRAWSRFALAGRPILTAGVAMWAVYSVLIPPRLGGDLQARLDPPDSRDARPLRPVGVDDRLDSASVSGLVLVEPARGDVHHHPPGASSVAASEATGVSEQSPSRVSLVPAEPLPFGLVLVAGSADLAEQILAEETAMFEDRAALVRNFTWAEAQRLAQQAMIEHARQARAAGDAPPLIASVDELSSADERGDLHEVARWASRRLQVLEQLAAEAGTHDVPPASGHVTGSQQLAPSIEQQVRFSQRGAALTVTVSLADLPRLLERLDRAPGSVTRLRMLGDGYDRDDESTPGAKILAMADSARDDWATQQLLIRESLSRLSEQDREMLLLLPIVIQIKSVD